MTAVLLKAFSFCFIIILGYTLKKIGFFKQTDHVVVSKILLNVTLPAAIINSFANVDVQVSLIFMVLIALVCNTILIILGYLFSIKMDDPTRKFYMINMTGYSVGSFTLPFIQSFIGPYGVVAICLFDFGNSIYCCGGAYAITSTVIGNKKKAGVKSIIKKLITSLPFDTYIIMLIISLIGIKIPVFISSVSSTIGSANIFIAMFSIGLMFEINFESGHIKDIIKTLATRYIFAVLAALVFYFLLPLPLEIRQVLIIVVFAPISVVAAAYTELSGGNSSLSSFVSSLSILFSLFFMIILMIVLGL
jgi:predicted permease